MNLHPKILFRVSLAEEEEMNIAIKCGFDCITSRAEIKDKTLIIPRYSALPFYAELEKDCELLGGKLINSYDHHRYVADLQNWYADLVDYTPKTWFSLEDALSQSSVDGPFIAKGETNGRKNLWRTHMFALNKEEVVQVYLRLQQDSLIGNQAIYIREMERFESCCESPITGQPILKEFRHFVYNSEILASGYYWSSFPEAQEFYKSSFEDGTMLEFVNKIANIIGDKIPFYVVDVAQRKDGEWRVIELNDGTMSGLSCINPEILYSKLFEALK